MVVESSSMAEKLGEEKDMEVELELELCLSLGGPFKKTENNNKRKRIRTECNSDFNNHKKKACDVPKPVSRVMYPYPYRVTHHSGEDVQQVKDKNVDNGYGYGSGKVMENSQTGSPVCSSSDISDPSSSPRQGGSSSDSGGNSNHTRPVEGPVKNGLETGKEEGKERSGKPPKASSKSNEESMLSFAQMPCVMSTGNGPEGRTVKGFLYRYSKAEVSIICVCHGRSFTPAEFIQHAGGTQVSHPLRHITVVPSAF